jgi:hypothetical protein
MQMIALVTGQTKCYGSELRSVIFATTDCLDTSSTLFTHYTLRSLLCIVRSIIASLFGESHVFKLHERLSLLRNASLMGILAS